MIKAEQNGDKYVLSFEGRMDTNACSAIEKEVLCHLDKADGTIVFDLKSVDFVSSAFLRICIVSAKTKGPGKLQVINAAPSIKKVFKIAGMDQLLI